MYYQNPCRRRARNCREPWLSSFDTPSYTCCRCSLCRRAAWSPEGTHSVSGLCSTTAPPLSSTCTLQRTLSSWCLLSSCAEQPCPNWAVHLRCVCKPNSHRVTGERWDPPSSKYVSLVCKRMHSTYKIRSK